MTPSSSLSKIALTAAALCLGISSMHAQQVADGGGWYGITHTEDSHRIDMDSATISGGNDVFISSDINNDGASDYIAAGVYTNAVSGTTWARLYAYSGFTGEILVVWENSTFNFGDHLEAAIVGDINSDGFPDILIGAPHASTRYKYHCGTAVLISGATGKTIKVWFGANANALFGASVAGVDDVDRNGFRDIIIGAPGATVNNKRVGAAHVFSGSWNGDPNFGQHVYTFHGNHDDSGFGSRVAAGDDVNRDGFPDILVSAPGFDSITGRSYPGAVDVYSGLDGSSLVHLEGRLRAQHFGYSIAGVGDIDRDGYPDIAIGAPSFAANAIVRDGFVVVVSGLTHQVIRKYTSFESSDGFGASIAAVGDTNGDFWPDIFIGAPDAMNGRGSATLFSGENDAILFRTLGDDTTSRMGTSLSAAGSLNRYGFVDLLALSSSATLGSQIARYAFVNGLGLPHGDTVSASNPSVVRLTVNMPSEMAGQVYQVIGTTTGTSLWVTPKGLQMPLTDSPFLRRTLSNSVANFFRNNVGTLDANGNAYPTIDFPAGRLSNLVGSSVHFCALVYDQMANIEATSVAAELKILY
ncbi:MAG: FG-GAP repeat protein [Planctomycetes bacterium]|nr:FG-GAP repeat protein [Planctomycetota bacterium]